MCPDLGRRPSVPGPKSVSCRSGSSGPNPSTGIMGNVSPFRSCRAIDANVETHGSETPHTFAACASPRPDFRSVACVAVAVCPVHSAFVGSKRRGKAVRCRDLLDIRRSWPSGCARPCRRLRDLHCRSACAAVGSSCRRTFGKSLSSIFRLRAGGLFVPSHPARCSQPMEDEAARSGSALQRLNTSFLHWRAIPHPEPVQLH